MPDPKSRSGFARAKDLKIPTIEPNSEASPRKIRGYGNKAGWAYHMLVAEPQVYTGFDKQVLTVTSLPWDVLPPEDPTDEELEQVAFIKDNWRKLEGGFAQVIQNSLTSRIFGFSLSELTFDIDDDSGLWALDSALWMAPWSVESWVLDESDRALGIVQLLRDKGAGRDFLPWQNLLHFGQMFWGRNYEGIPVVRPYKAYWDHKSQILSNDLVARKRASTGILKATPPPTMDRANYPAEFDHAQQILDTLAYAEDEEDLTLIPPSGGWEIKAEYLERVPELGETLSYLDHSLASGMSDNVAELGQTPYGSKAGAQVLEQERYGMMAGLCSILGNAIDHKVHREIYRLNGWNQKRMCKTSAGGFKDQMLIRRLFEYITAEAPERPLVPVDESTIAAIKRALGAGGM